MKVKNIKVVDPACGSGAFLNKAADILLEIHQEIHETRYKGKKETLKPYFDNIGQRREILLNNIYGVDLNEESVDITKLSLFLKVCRKGLILPNLEKNIKCGNSLINDPEFSDKPFKWEEEFPNIFKEGKFDIVIGNPPYVRVQNLLYKDIDYYKKAFTCAYKRIDISVLFIELANYLLKENGLNAYITSNQFLKSEYGRKTREYILENYNIQKIIDFGDLPIFGDAITYVSIFIFKKGKTLEFDYYNVIKVDTDLNTINPMIINPEYLGDESWLLENIEFQKIYDKINKFPPLKKNKCKCWTGIKTGRDKVFIFDLKDIKNIKIEEEVMLPLLTSKDCDRYNYPTSSKYVIYPYKLVDSKTVLLSEEEIKNKYPQLYKYLLDNKEEIFLRKDSRKNFSKKSNWYSLTRFGRIDIFNKEKIIFPGISKINKFGLDKEGYVFLGASVYAITSEDPDVSLKYLLTILNSTLIEKYLHSITPLKKGGFYSYLASHIDNLSIPMIDSTLQKPFIIKTNKNIQLSNEFKDEINGFKGWLQRTFNMETFSKKLDKYYKLSLDEFSAELNKKKVDTTQRKTQELLKQEFEKSIAVIKPLLQEIEQTDNEINQMVYDLYGLTSKEIKIIEGSLN